MVETVTTYFPQANVPEMWSGVGTTGAGGLLIINFPTPFTAPPAVNVTPLTASDNLTNVHLHSVTINSVTIHARQAGSVVLLGIQLLAFPSDAVGVELHVHAIERGDFV